MAKRSVVDLGRRCRIVVLVSSRSRSSLEAPLCRLSTSLSNLRTK